MKNFIKFLEDNNAWENFERAFKNYHTDVKKYKNKCKKNINVALVAAFNWSRTKEGFHYWEKLDDKWIRENRALKQKLLSND